MNDDYCSTCGKMDDGTLPDLPGGSPPLSHCMRSIRGALSELILLERHLSDPKWYCADCIRKHFFAAESLASEAASLDKVDACPIAPLVLRNKIRSAQSQWADGVAPETVAQTLRTIRKAVLPHCFDWRLTGEKQ